MKIYTAGAYEALDLSLPVESNFANVGYNLGNAAISRGVKAVVQHYLNLETQRFAGQDVTPNDVLMIGAANWLSRFSDISWLDLDEVAKFRTIVVLGLGVQHEISSVDELHPSVKKLLDLMMQRRGGIGTREKVSAELLRAFGLTNTFWTGCPSLRIPKLGLDVSRPRQVGYGGSMEVIGHSTSPDSLRKLESDAIVALKDSTLEQYFLQGEKDLILAVANVDHDGINAFIKSRTGQVLDGSQVRSCFSYHFSVADWIRNLSYFRTYLGTRLHGNILAWHAGCKGYLIGHDKRTMSFVNDFSFPGLSVREYRGFDQLRALIERADYSEFVENLKRTETNLVELLDSTMN